MAGTVRRTVRDLFGGSGGGEGGGGLTPVFITDSDSPYSASAGELVLCDSSAGAITVTKPATPSDQDRVAIYDTGGAAATNNITVGRNGETINGDAEDFVIDQNYGQYDASYDGTGTDWKAAFSGTDNDAIHDNASGEIAALTKKTAIVDADHLLIEDTEDSNNKKRAKVGDVRGLNESEVDARVLAVTGPVRHANFFPEAGITVSSFQAPTAEYDASVAGDLRVFQYTDTQDNFSILNWIPPSNWDGGTIRFRYWWYPTTTAAGNVRFFIAAFAGGEGDTPASPGNVNVLDTSLQVVDDIQISPWSEAYDTNGDVGDIINMMFVGNGSNAAWSTTSHARVMAVQIEYSIVSSG